MFPIRLGGPRCTGPPNRPVPMRCSATRSRNGSPVNRAGRSSTRCRGRIERFWLVARTKLIDDAIADALADGCDRVLNLAAGLDARPYRLDLPSELTWVEADLPELLAEKTQALADQTPRCRLTRTASTSPTRTPETRSSTTRLTVRRRLWCSPRGCRCTSSPPTSSALSHAIQRPEVAWWMLDFAFPGLKSGSTRTSPRSRRTHRSSSPRKTGWPSSKIWAGGPSKRNRCSGPPTD